MCFAQGAPPIGPRKVGCLVLVWKSSWGRAKEDSTWLHKHSKPGCAMCEARLKTVLFGSISSVKYVCNYCPLIRKELPGINSLDVGSMAKCTRV